MAALLIVWVKEAQGCALDECALIAPSNTIPVYYSPTAAEEAEIEVLKIYDYWGDEIATTSPEYLLEFYAQKWGLATTSLARQIIFCESGWDRFAQNPKSSASGWWQFLDGVWLTTLKKMGIKKEVEKTHETLSMEAGVWLLKKEGVKHWSESQNCWK